MVKKEIGFLRSRLVAWFCGLRGGNVSTSKRVFRTQREEEGVEEGRGQERDACRHKKCSH